jgi:hypothetical protein
MLGTQEKRGGLGVSASLRQGKRGGLGRSKTPSCWFPELKRALRPAAQSPPAQSLVRQQAYGRRVAKRPYKLHPDGVP